MAALQVHEDLTSNMITLNINLMQALGLANTLEPKLEQVLKNAAQSLALQTHAHLLEQVQDKLHSTREKYSNALSFTEINSNVFVISLDQSMLWLEEGMAEKDMLDSLLKSPKAKVSATGNKYLVVPFAHNKSPGQQTQAGKSLTDTIKTELKKRQIPFAKIERTSEGKAKTGLLHSFDITKAPIKSAEGPGMGHGPVGAVRQGVTGIPHLLGVRIYQKETNAGIKRGIMTFRVASSAQRGTGQWRHPGIEPRHFFEEAHDWAMQTWAKIADEIMKEVNI